MELSIKEQSENAIKWIEALRSGKYKQAREALGDEERGFCCWGLGCFVVGKEYIPHSGWDRGLYPLIGFSNESGFIKPEVGFSDSLARLNDDLRLSFPEIATYLIEHAGTNFMPEVAQAIKEHFNTP